MENKMVDKRVIYPDNRPIDIMKCRNLSIVYPDQKIHNIIAEHVQETEDGRFVLTYLEFVGKMLTQKYTEIHFIDGEWSKKPFDLDYSRYSFKPFDKTLSDAIINQLPEKLVFRIHIRPDQIAIKADAGESVLEATNVGSKVVKAQEEKTVFMVLPALTGDSILDKKEFDFDFAFPAFSYLGNTDHNADESMASYDINWDQNYEEQMFLREEIPMSVRRTVSSFLKEGDNSEIHIPSLPILEVQGDNEVTNICFISCPQLVLFGTLYKADKIFVDNETPTSGTYDNKIESAFHGEIPMIIETHNGVKISNYASHTKEPVDGVTKS